MKNLIKNSPLVSVVMPVYNAGNFLHDSIQSILDQDYKDFEFIIVDDASTDNSWKIIKDFKKKDKRIKCFRFKKNLGVTSAVKFAIAKTKGRFLARMDADDIAHPKRLKQQVEYLLNNPQLVAVGTQCYLIDEKNKIIGEKKFPIKFEEIYSYILKFIPLQQPTLMINRSKLPKDFQFYNNRFNTAEEIELIFKLFQYGKIENLEKKLHYYRLHQSNSSLKEPKKTFFLTLLSRIKAIFLYGYKPSLEGIIFTIAQTIVVAFLPNFLIIKLYWFLRNNNKKKNNAKLIIPHFKLRFAS